MRAVLLILFLTFYFTQATSQLTILEKKEQGAFPLVTPSGAATILWDSEDDSLIKKVSLLLQADILMVTGKEPLVMSTLQGGKRIILIGNMNDSKLIRQLVNSKKINLKELENKWEAFQIQAVQAPFKGVDQALVITGSDRRGTAYGVLELSQQIGVSPLHWWANVPAKKQNALYVKRSVPYVDAPKVKYRGL